MRLKSSRHFLNVEDYKLRRGFALASRRRLVWALRFEVKNRYSQRVLRGWDPRRLKVPLRQIYDIACTIWQRYSVNTCIFCDVRENGKLPYDSENLRGNYLQMGDKATVHFPDWESPL